MKKIIIIAIMILLIPFYAFAAGTITQLLDATPDQAKAVLTFTCTADSSNGSFPNATTTDAVLAKIKGMYIDEVRTYPQTTNPTALWDAVLNDAGGLDLMGGTLADRSASAAQRAIPAMATSIYGGSMIMDAPILVITGNSVNSAGIIVKVFLSK